jgi:hypothetical protein
MLRKNVLVTAAVCRASAVVSLHAARPTMILVYFMTVVSAAAISFDQQQSCILCCIPYTVMITQFYSTLSTLHLHPCCAACP